jgi:hypothetical protein
MTRRDKDLACILDPASDAATSFDVLVVVLQRLGFELRIRGNHHVFSRVGVVEISTSRSGGASQSLIRSVRFGVLS